MDQNLLNENHHYCSHLLKLKQTTIPPNTFTAQDAGIYSSAELDQFWYRIFFSKHSDSKLQPLGKALSYSFISSNTPDYDANSSHFNPYNTLRIGSHDNLTAELVNDKNDTHKKHPNWHAKLLNS